jgi:cell wall-associated NlpC family hydrolase
MKLRFIFYVGFFLILFSSCGTLRHGSQRRTDKEISKIIRYAGNFTGTSYRTGGNSPKGFDCSGFIQYVFKEFNYRLPRTTVEQSKMGTKIAGRKKIRPGDLVFFTGKNQRSKKVGHAGIVVDVNGRGNFRFIHASTTGGVMISRDTESYYKSRYLLARRIVK